MFILEKQKSLKAITCRGEKKSQLNAKKKGHNKEQSENNAIEN